MESHREIKFVTAQSKNRLTEGKTCCQGLLRHNAVLSERETRKAFAASGTHDRGRDGTSRPRFQVPRIGGLKGHGSV